MNYIFYSSSHRKLENELQRKWREKEGDQEGVMDNIQKTSKIHLSCTRKQIAGAGREREGRGSDLLFLNFIFSAMSR